jgi:ligand-binding sensor domain-containing protein
MENKMKKTICLLSIFIAILYSVFSQNPEWIIYNTGNSQLPSDRVTSIVIDKKNKIWIGTTNGLVSIDGKNWNLYNTSNSNLIDNFITAIEIDKDDNIWIGTYFNLTRFDGQNWNNYPIDGAVNINDILIDKSNNIWIANTNYLAKFNGSVWVLYYSYDYGLNQKIQTIACDSNNVIWIGTGEDQDTGGIAKIDSSNWTIFTEANSELPDGNILHITIDNYGNKWIGTDVGLTRFNDTNWYTFNSNNSNLKCLSIKDIEIDDSLNIWAGCLSGGIYKYNGQYFNYYNLDNQDFWINGLSDLAIDSAGNKWVSSYSNGLAVFREGGVVGVEEPVANKEFSISCYPNPASNTFNLNFNNAPQIDLPAIKIYSILGNEMLLDAKNISEYSIEFDISPLPQGVYFVNVPIGTKIERLKFVKMN